MRRTLLIAALLAATGAPALAERMDDDGGTLNPLDTGVGRALKNIREGRTDMMTCALGYYITKAGNHEDARELFRACAEAGYTAAMTWMSQMENNGLGAPEDPVAAAEWDRRAAEAGDPVASSTMG